MKVLLNILTHGDETAGIQVAERVAKLPLLKGSLTINRANELAFAKRRRFIDQDLNRTFPGKRNGNHEEKLAHAILPLVKAADMVIDIHTTTSGLRDTIILTNPTIKTREYVDIIRPRYALVMNATKHNALISQARIGIAFEYGGNTERTIRGTVAGIERLLAHINMIQSRRKPLTRKTHWLNVHSSIAKPDGATLLPRIKNYNLVTKGEAFAVQGSKLIYAQENFYPILFGENSYKEIFGFAASQI